MTNEKNIKHVFHSSPEQRVNKRTQFSSSQPRRLKLNPLESDDFYFFCHWAVYGTHYTEQVKERVQHFGELDDKMIKATSGFLLAQRLEIGKQ